MRKQVYLDRARVRAWALFAALVLLAGCYQQTKFKSVDVGGASWGKSLALTGHDGGPRTLDDFKGRFIVLTFGFTNCPDICPTTLAEIARVRANLKAGDAARVQVLFMTLDPERDTRAVLANYVPAFDPSFIGLYGDLETTRQTAKEFRIFFQKVKPDAPGRYAVDHSAQSYVFDPQGRLRLLVKHESLAQDLAHDLKELLQESAKHSENAKKG